MNKSTIMISFRLSTDEIKIIKMFNEYLKNQTGLRVNRSETLLSLIDKGYSQFIKNIDNALAKIEEHEVELSKIITLRIDTNKLLNIEQLVERLNSKNNYQLNRSRLIRLMLIKGLELEAFSNASNKFKAQGEYSTHSDLEFMKPAKDYLLTNNFLEIIVGIIGGFKEYYQDFSSYQANFNQATSYLLNENLHQLNISEKEKYRLSDELQKGNWYKSTDLHQLKIKNPNNEIQRNSSRELYFLLLVKILSISTNDATVLSFIINKYELLRNLEGYISEDIFSEFKSIDSLYNSNEFDFERASNLFEGNEFNSQITQKTSEIVKFIEDKYLLSYYIKNEGIPHIIEYEAVYQDGELMDEFLIQMANYKAPRETFIKYAKKIFGSNYVKKVIELSSRNSCLISYLPYKEKKMTEIQNQKIIKENGRYVLKYELKGSSYIDFIDEEIANMIESKMPKELFQSSCRSILGEDWKRISLEILQDYKPSLIPNLKILCENQCSCPPVVKGMDEMCPPCLEKYENELFENQEEHIKSGRIILPDTVNEPSEDE